MVVCCGMARKLRLEFPGAREIPAMRWAEALARRLRILGKTAFVARADRKGTPWKAAIALHLQQTTSAQSQWLADQLQLGRRDAVSCYLARLKAAGLASNRDDQELITNVSTCPLWFVLGCGCTFRSTSRREEKADILPWAYVGSSALPTALMCHYQELTPVPLPSVP